MFFRLKHSRALLLVALVLALACPLSATQTTKQLANGVTLYQEIITDHRRRGRASDKLRDG